MTTAPTSTIVQRLWTCGCNILRDERRLSVVGEIESAVEAGLARAACRAYRDIESLRGRMSVSERQALCGACRTIEGLFESLLLKP